MARIDRYIEVLFQRRADRVRFAAGERVVLVSGEASRPLTSAALHAKILTELVREIAPTELAEEVLQPGQHAFEYTSPAGAVVVRVAWQGEQCRLELVREASGPPTPTAAAAPVAAAKPEAAPAQKPAATRPAPPAAASEPARSTAGMDALLREMVDAGCSDLHLSSGSAPMFRKDGSLVSLSSRDACGAEQVKELVYSITPPERRAHFEDCGDADFAYEIPGLARFRCNLFLDRLGMGGVFRVIPSEILTAEDLGLSSQILELCHLSKGLVVVTGPTGSGKSTTLAAMVDYINRQRSDHIITIEDPIEFVHPNKKCLINQREIGSHTRGFKSALRAALREDPDIVLVGELRDLETVEIAIETAETGHLVFATLHTNTAASTVDRIIDQFPSDRQGQIRTMLSSSLRGVIAQTLCRKTGGGRVAALEVLIVTPAVSNLIREAKTFQIPSVMQSGKKLGMMTLNDALMALVAAGDVEPRNAAEKAVARDEFRKMLSGRGIELESESEPG